MVNKDKIIVAEEFSRTPGARYIYEGNNSGEKFLNDVLLPKFEKAVIGEYKIAIYLDGVIGYPSSFISGSFGKLSIMKGASTVINHLEFISNNKLRIEKILLEIKNPKQK